jgi:hypothetical protein
MKVDMARRKGGIFIVKAHWFTDSMNAWERQDEQLYLLDPSPRRERATKSPIETYSQQPVDVEGHDPGGVVQAMIDEFEEDADDDEDLDDDLDIEAQQELEPIALGTWQDATDEVDAYLMESDSEVGDGEETSDIILGEGESESGRWAHFFHSAFVISLVEGGMNLICADYMHATVYRERQNPEE